MRVKLLASLLLVAALVCTGMLTTVSESGTKTRKPSEVAAPAGPAHRARPEQPVDDDPHVTDGEKHPERIPDHVAYSLLFRMIADRKTDEEKGRIRAYLTEVGLGRSECPTCPKLQPQDAAGRGTDADADALIAAAEEYHQKVGVLDRRAKELKQRGKAAAIPNVKGQLTALQRQKEVLVIGIANSLSARLSVNGLEKVRRHVNERVKRKVKIRTEPGRPEQANQGGGSAT